MRTLQCKQSETFRRAFRFRKAQTKENVDFTGCQAFCQMRTSAGGDLIAEATCTIDIDLGRVVVLWTKEQTKAISPGLYCYDVWLKCGDDQRPFVTEQVEIVPTITEIE